MNKDKNVKCVTAICIFALICSLVCSIIIKTWIPFVVVVASPVIIAILGILSAIFHRKEKIIVIDKSMFKKDYSQYIDESRFDQDDDEGFIQ
ncbi:hypothetical protein LCGC14_1760510 [marine sediment metagenome]|uniref:Uncharacterized protein n=1 Tax=marine sediment metagenome TaxID=412755 RepID=A0A0F9H192_9ZZZZ